MQDIRQFLLDYIQKEYSIPSGIDINTLNYVESGYVDSIGMIRFVIATEEEFGIEFTDEELSEPSFKVMGSLVSLIERKMGQMNDEEGT